MDQVQAYTEEQLATAGWVFEKNGQPDPEMPRYAFVTMANGSATLTEDDKAILASCDGLFLRGTGLQLLGNRCLTRMDMGISIYWYSLYSPTGLVYANQSKAGVLTVKGLIKITDTEAVKYTTQILTDVQKAQARTNIGVQTSDELLADAQFVEDLGLKLSQNPTFAVDVSNALLGTSFPGDIAVTAKFQTALLNDSDFIAELKTKLGI